MIVDLLAVLISLVLVVGLIEYLKKVWLKAPSWVWKVALPILSIIVFLVISLLPPWLVGIALVIAGGQLFYQVIVKFIATLREKLAK